MEITKKQIRTADALPALLGFAAFSSALLCTTASTALADWTPPESSITPPAVLTLDAFSAPDWNGANPSAPLAVGPDGALYGSTYYGGASGYGTLFRVETNGAFTKLHDFNGTDGALPSAALVVGPDDALYGLAGTVFRVETNGAFTKLHHFNGPDGFSPSALVVGPDGALYGSTWYGGATWTNGYGYGTLFRLETNGGLTKLHDFTGLDGIYPSCLMVGPDGALYGSTYTGGASGTLSFAGYGTLFRLTTNGIFRKLHDFNGVDGDRPSVPLVVGPDSALYGSTFFGGTAQGPGVLFRITTGGSFTKLHDFQGPDGYYPSEPLAVGPDGGLYGSTLAGGSSGNGVLFRVSTNGIFTMLHDFTGTDGVGPTALVVGPDGAVYGSTLYSGTNGWGYGYGTLFRLETNGNFDKLHQFTGGDGSHASAAPAVGPDGVFYSCTWDGGLSGCGTVFRLGTNGTFGSVHEFSRSTEGAYPRTDLVPGGDGALYGLTPEKWDWQNWKQLSYGTIFRLTADGSFTNLHDFDGPDGSNPSALAVGPDGALYGSTGGAFSTNYGTLFRLATDGTFAKLHEFNGPASGWLSWSLSRSLIAGPDGALYGSTGNWEEEADVSCPAIWPPDPNCPPSDYNGKLFRLETNGTFTTLHDFFGTYPSALVTGPDGALYGSTSGIILDFGGWGGWGQYVMSYGELFRIKIDGTFTNMLVFNGTNGFGPAATLAVGPDSALYGSTSSGGTSGYGTLFRLETNGAFTELHDFTGTDGALPSAALVVGPDGALYGSTYSGGTSNQGTLFRLGTNGSFTQVHDFTGIDGSGPSAALAVGPDGALYGSAQFGGISSDGTLFRFSTNGAFTKLYDFTGANGAYPLAALVAGPDGALYGSTPSGGPRGGGILFKLVLNRFPVADANATPALVISPDGTHALVVLDGSRSSDPDGDTLQYAWYEAGNLLTTGAVSVAVLPVGVHTIQLVVNDGTLSATANVTIDVVTTAQAADRLLATVHANVAKPQPLVATLRAALSSIEQGKPVAATNQLLAFQNQVQVQIAPLDAALAATLIQSAQNILEAIQSGAVGLRGRFTSLVRQSNGNVRLQFSGERAGIYIIETSTNLLNWDRIGTATSLTNGQFQFEDTKASQHWRLFYRVVQP